MGDTARSDQSQPQPASGAAQQLHPVSPAGSRHKEHGFITQSEPLVQPTIPEVQVPPELKEHGVEASVAIHAPQLDQTVQAAGVRVVSDAVTLPQAPTGVVSLPMSEERAETIKKTVSWKESVRWFAELILVQSRKRLLPKTQS